MDRATRDFEEQLVRRELRQRMNAEESLFYRQGVPDFDVFIERATERTPDQKRYHIFVAGRCVASFAFFKPAKECYRERVAALRDAANSALGGS